MPNHEDDMRPHDWPGMPKVSIQEQIEYDRALAMQTFPRQYSRATERKIQEMIDWSTDYNLACNPDGTRRLLANILSLRPGDTPS